MLEVITLKPKLWFESYPIWIDWNPVIKDQAITGFVVSAVDEAGNPSSLATHVSQANGVEELQLTGGIAGRTYTVTVEVTLTDGSVFDKDIKIPVVDKLTPIKVLQKQTTEKIDLGVFFTDEIGDDIISSATLFAVDSNNNSVDILDDRGFDVTCDLVSFRVRDGVDGQDYIINVRIDTDNSNILGDQILIRVRNT